MYKRALLLLGGLSVLTTLAVPALAQRPGAGGWEQLGCVEINRRADFDVIRVGRRDGMFRAIRLDVFGNDVLLENLRVVYGNGAPDDIPVRREFREGTSSRAIDLKGRLRFIDRIEIVSKRDFRGRGRGRARICVSGLAAPRQADVRPMPPRVPSRGAEWVELGCQKVGFLVDRDVIRVGRREGRFRAIRLTASGNSVDLIRLKVVYANGQPDDIPFQGVIRENRGTGPIDLKGRERSISRVELVYRAMPNFRGSARVCLLGRD